MDVDDALFSATYSIYIPLLYALKSVQEIKRIL